MTEQWVQFEYTNHRGESGTRTVLPDGQIRFGRTEYHPEEQWLLDGYCCDRKQQRTFAMKDIRNWRPLAKE